MNPKPWLKNYHPDVPAEINPDVHASITELFEETVNKFQHRTVFEHMGVCMDYTQLSRKVNQFAAYLQQQLGLEKGDRLAIMLPNCFQYIISMLAAFKIGLIVINVNPVYTKRELIHQLNDALPKVIIVLANVADILAAVLPKINLQHIIITELGDAFPLPKAIMVNCAIKYIKKMIPKYTISSFVHFRQALRKGRQCQLKPVKLSGSDIAFLQYTGGTTGVAKGAMLTHRNMVANVEQAYTWIKPILPEQKPIAITPLPLFHVFSLMASCLVFMKAGVHNVLVSNPRDLASIVKVFATHKVNAMMGVNTLFNALVHNKYFAAQDFTELGLVIAGGMALQKAVSDKWLDVTGMSIIEGYGLTETSPIVTISKLDARGYTGNIGLPISSTEVMIVDAQGNALAEGEVGELCVRGPQVMAGYYQCKDETSDVMLPDGWLKTGDIASIDAQGYVTIVDRKKDMIAVAGYNVYPNEVEAVLAEHPMVAEVAVIGVPNRVTGESVLACIVRKDKNLTKADLLRFCKEQLVSYKVPRRVKFFKDLPKSNVGKVLRRALREKILA